MISVLFLFLIVAVVCAAIRFIRGPSQTDRVVMFDLLTAILIAAAVLIAIFLNDIHVMSLAIVLSILSFVGTSVLAFYLEKNRRKQ
ncbi:monovalent cation/H+ antiporter complex subunit F [Bdellovibrio sp. HCB209]|uniref:monovalent cation/H+ antiporter complex subunit F n=1 Tax=Bdellovibrio sp. HCB209 TaxID=3394354 RepID=UPI0039B42178